MASLGIKDSCPLIQDVRIQDCCENGPLRLGTKPKVQWWLIFKRESSIAKTIHLSLVYIHAFGLTRKRSHPTSLNLPFHW